MNLLELRGEVQARGYDYLTDDRVDRYVNQAYYELCALMPWPFLETTATGSSPLAIPDVRYVLNVTDTTNRRALTPADPRNLRMIDPDLSDTGAPCAWYLEGTTVTVWPATSVTLDVRYIKAPADLVATTDEPVVPGEWQDIIVDGAVCKAAKDNDGYAAMQMVRAEWQRQVDVMVQALMNRALDGPGTIATYEHKDY